LVALYKVAVAAAVQEAVLAIKIIKQQVGLELLG
jgi:hypothetical protein